GFSVGGLVVNARGRTSRRIGTVYSIFIVCPFLACERQRHCSRDAVVGDMLHHRANQLTGLALFEYLPGGFRDLELLAYFLTAQGASKLGYDRVLDQRGRNGLGGTGVPSVLARLLADVITKPPAALGRVGRDHRPITAFAEQQSGQQRLLVGPDHLRAATLAGRELSPDLFP